MVESLSGKNTILTGASRGLGVRIAHALWKYGANLLLVARSKDALKRLQSSFQANASPNQHASILAVNLKSPEAIGKIVDQAYCVFNGRLDVLINNAGILGPVGRCWENDWEEWQDTIRVNLLAPIALCRACIPWMKQGGGGKIVNLSGGGATGPRPNFSAYAVAKTGIVRFTELVAHEVSDMNIQINSVAPGAMNTDMLQSVLDAGPGNAGTEEYSRALKQAHTGGVDPDQAAELCAFLASSASEGITGKLISAVWDHWQDLPNHVRDLANTDLYTLRRIVPKDRDRDWG